MVKALSGNSHNRRAGIDLSLLTRILYLTTCSVPITMHWEYPLANSQDIHFPVEMR